MIHKYFYPKTYNKKGLTTLYGCKPFIIMVGADRFELSTSTVSG